MTKDRFNLALLVMGRGPSVKTEGENLQDFAVSKDAKTCGVELNLKDMMMNARKKDNAENAQAEESAKATPTDPTDAEVATFHTEKVREACARVKLLPIPDAASQMQGFSFIAMIPDLIQQATSLEEINDLKSSVEAARFLQSQLLECLRSVRSQLGKATAKEVKEAIDAEKAGKQQILAKAKAAQLAANEQLKKQIYQKSAMGVFQIDWHSAGHPALLDIESDEKLTEVGSMDAGTNTRTVRLFRF